jgi:hypothetical protein
MKNDLITVGWREWVYLPDLHIDKIKAKVDTGARTSCLHAFQIDPYTDNGVEKVHFLIHPIQKRDDIVDECDAVVLDKRMVSDSGGHREMRYVISTRLVMGPQEWDIEMTLTSRDSMMFRMLLGRTAMENRILVDPARSYLMGKHVQALDTPQDDEED